MQKENGLNEVISYYYDSCSPFRLYPLLHCFSLHFSSFILRVRCHDVLFKQMEVI